MFCACAHRMLQQRAERKAQEKAAKVEARQQRKETRQANVAAMTPEELAAHKAQVEVGVVHSAGGFT